ncbi:phosphatidate cytidylyltransferase [Desulfonatronum sp. SC1]|uniref:phosphatidate cytidylyltransferase n=1 Tax=Desulfonatronum sp. SC1 TaxID=2109626 RepID=UPI000D31499F|nr:phosphatidate cytidylyltransferase [Desulfonatronum sp. SC1]PTN38919.1 phosphatidate cytidylyltransferase [Desulfonatronum sp. SC1]
MPLTSHHKRLLTGLLPLPILLWILFSGGVPLLLLVMILAALGQWELYSMFWKGERPGWKVVGVTSGAFFLLAAYLAPPAVPAALAGLFCLFGVLFLVSYSSDPETASFSDALLLFWGCCYLPLLLHFALGLAWPELLLVVAAAFLSDTAAYYTGSKWGRRHVWPSISPKKTWEGSGGGMAACVGACVIVGLAWGAASAPAFILLGVVLNLAAQVGDFFESAVKRSQSVKDSGTLLPGHGGILDRIDSLLFVLPAYSALSLVYPFF